MNIYNLKRYVITYYLSLTDHNNLIDGVASVWGSCARVRLTKWQTDWNLWVSFFAWSRKNTRYYRQNEKTLIIFFSVDFFGHFSSSRSRDMVSPCNLRTFFSPSPSIKSSDIYHVKNFCFLSHMTTSGIRSLKEMNMLHEKKLIFEF